MATVRHSRPVLEVLSRGYREVTRVQTASDALQRRIYDPRNPDRRRDVEALDALEFQEKILRTTIDALESAGSND